MENKLTIKTEQLDDIPLLLSQLEQMGVGSLLDSHFPSHGNWEGLSPGQVACVWLTHILSESNHCLDHVRPWAAQRIESLKRLVHPEIKELDFTDDRLANLISRFSDMESWNCFESALNQQLLRTYDLKGDCIRHDSTSCSSFRSFNGEESSLFQYGHSKDHRPDLPQLKMMLATLDPLGMPLATEILPGNCADDPLYIPSIIRVQESLKTKGLLHVGDSKLSALETRAYLVFSGDAYLCPLSKKQLSDEALQSYLQEAFEKGEAFLEIYRLNAKGENVFIAEGFEREHQLTAEVQEIPFCWKERHLIVRSHSYAQAAQRGLEQRLQTAQKQLEALHQKKQGKRRPKDRQSLEECIETILTRHQVSSILEVSIEEISLQRKVRAYKNNPASLRLEWDFQLQVSLNQIQLAHAIRGLGWRVYATPLSQAQFSLEDAVLCYRNEFRIEHNFKRIKGPLSLRPMYLTREDHITGLLHLLTLALRVLTLTEFQIRQQLQKQKEPLPGLYPGNPKRATFRPTTEKLLQAFKNIHLNVITQSSQVSYHLNDLSDLQLRILTLLNLPQNLYYQVRGHF